MIVQPIVPTGSIEALAANLTSSTTGLVRRLGVESAIGCTTKAYSAYAELADTRALGCCGEIQMPGGTGFTIRDAITRALFEAVERYCGAFFDQSKAVWGKATDRRFIYGDLYPLYTEEQYRRPNWPFVPLTQDSELWWTAGRCLHTGETCYVPSALVYIPYEPVHRDECIGPSLSTGMAAGWSWEEACLSGLYEVCERDAFAMMWATRRSGPRLLPHPGSALDAEVNQVLRLGKTTVTLIDISNDLRVPTAVAMLRHHGPYRSIASIGSAAKATLEQACRKALAEAVSSQQALRSYLDGPDAEWLPESDFSNVNDWKWHPLLYTLPEFCRELDFITSSPHTRALGREVTGKVNVRSFARCLRKHFPQLLAVELTTPDLAELGVSAVKVIAPQAVPLEPDHRYRREAIPRLQALDANINPLPHPFL